MLVSVNVWQIANQKWVGAVLVGWAISFAWTINVKGIAFGGWADRVSYATGAAAGTATGIFLVSWLYG